MWNQYCGCAGGRWSLVHSACVSVSAFRQIVRSQIWTTPVTFNRNYVQASTTSKFIVRSAALQSWQGYVRPMGPPPKNSSSTLKGGESNNDLGRNLNMRHYFRLNVTGVGCSRFPELRFCFPSGFEISSRRTDVRRSTIYDDLWGSEAFS